MKCSFLLGRYENFPGLIHGVARFASPSSTAQVQQAILHALYQLNHEVCSLKEVVLFSTLKCEVSFEFGVAEGGGFNYLDAKELGRLRKSIAKKVLSVIDFFCVIRYHVNKEGKRVPLKFDYQMLRFMFHNGSVELRVIHERGVQRVSLGDLITFIVKHTNEEISKERLKPLTLEYLRTL